MGIFQSRSWQAGESGAINGDGMEELELALGEGQGGAGTTAPRHQGRDSHPRKGIIAASRRVLEASFLHRDHHSWHSAAQPCRVDMAHGTRMVAMRSRAVLRLGGVRGGAQTTVRHTTERALRARGQIILK
jgi:hypothetical protein